jgi:hypothetical protein
MVIETVREKFSCRDCERAAANEYSRLTREA